jgi:hypothetical protein
MIEVIKNRFHNSRLASRITMSLAMAILIISSTLSLYLYLPIYGHNFSANESAVFLALADTIKAEAQLVQENLSNNNVSLASEHANKASALFTAALIDEIAERNQRLADELNTALTTLKTSVASTSDNDTATDINSMIGDVDAILDEAVTARINPEQLDNSTTQVLRIIEIIDNVLGNYGDAFAVGFDMTNMSNLITDNRDNGSNSLSSMRLINVTDYQTAQALGVKAHEILNAQLSNSSSNPQSLDNIASALQELMKTIDSKGTPNDVMMIVHTRIHPNFLTAFDLNPSIH